MEKVICSGCNQEFELDETQMIEDKLYCFGCVDHYDDQQDDYGKDSLDE